MNFIENKNNTLLKTQLYLYLMETLEIYFFNQKISTLLPLVLNSFLKLKKNLFRDYIHI